MISRTFQLKRENEKENEIVKDNFCYDRSCYREAVNLGIC
jgi:hypothetical protein